MSTPHPHLSFLTEDSPRDSGLYIRGDGRQLVIETGRESAVDEAEDEALDAIDERQSERPCPSTRGRIQTFSDASRRNLRRTVHSIRRDARALFVSLTYHETNPHPRTAKKHLDRFWKALRYHHGELSAVWKMELQKRGTVHFHLMIYGTTWIRAEWLSKLWHNCTEEQTDAHRKSGADTQWINPNEDGKVQAYLAKYMGKGAKAEDMPFENPGRWWGILDRANLPVAAYDHFHRLDRHDADRLIRTLLDRWGLDMDEWSVPRLTVNTRGNPHQFVFDLLGSLQ